MSSRKLRQKGLLKNLSSSVQGKRYFFWQVLEVIFFGDRNFCSERKKPQKKDQGKGDVEVAGKKERKKQQRSKEWDSARNDESFLLKYFFDGEYEMGVHRGERKNRASGFIYIFSIWIKRFQSSTRVLIFYVYSTQNEVPINISKL